MYKHYKKQIELNLKNWFKFWRQEYETSLMSEIQRFTMAGGKRLRPALMITSYQAFGGHQLNEIIKTSCCWELLHSYFLIHDDILDQDEMRRGQPTVWSSLTKATKNKHQGQSLAILAGDMAANLAYDILLQTKVPNKHKIQALKIFQQIANDVLYGQILDMELQKQTLFTEAKILQVHKYKTAKYTLEGPLHLGAVLAGSNKQKLKLISKFALPVGLAFQIQDDILGMFGDEDKLGKPVGSDLREGKKTLLILKALELGTKNEQKIIKSTLGQNQLSKKQIELTQNIIIKTGSLDYSQDLSKKLISRAQKALDKLKLSPKYHQELSDMSDYIISRSK